MILFLYMIFLLLLILLKGANFSTNNSKMHFACTGDQWCERF